MLWQPAIACQQKAVLLPDSMFPNLASQRVMCLSSPGAGLTPSCSPTCSPTCLQVLRLSEEQLSGGVLDDSCLAVIARGCTQLQELELVQVSR